MLLRQRIENQMGLPDAYFAAIAPMPVAAMPTLPIPSAALSIIGFSSPTSPPSGQKGKEVPFSVM